MQLSLRKADFSLPLTTMSGLVVAFSLGVAALLIGRFDDAAFLRERTLVQNAVGSHIEELAKPIMPQVIWDEAVHRLDNHFDNKWAHENLGIYLFQTLHVQFSTLLDSNDRPIYGSVAGKDVVTPRLPRDKAVDILIASIRNAEKERGPLPAGIQTNGEISKPITANTILNIDGEPHALVALLVSPDFGRYRPRSARAPILLAARRLDGDFLSVISDRVMLDGIHLHTGVASEAGEAHAVLTDKLGRPVATLDWLPIKPGRQMIGEIGPALTSVAVILLTSLVLLFRRSRRIANGLIASEARATHLAFHDTLTGLANRAMFIQRLTEGLSRLGRSGESVTVLCLDLDRFKEIDDTYGHLVGDELIRQASSRAARLCRSHEALARLSGDEFAIVQVDGSPDDAATLAGRICDALSQPFDLSAGRVFISCSVGIAVASNADIEPAELLRQADLALYRAKATGRGRFCFFDPEMDALIKARRLLEEDLRIAIRTDGLTMAYQPQVDGDGRMTGVEALVRWRHPERGDIGPAYFVPIAEQCGLIRELGTFTLRRAFTDSRDWKGLRTAINISANQLQAKDFLPSLESLIAETGIDPTDFDLEITEGVLLRDDPDMHETLEGLRELGFSLALDDFGTGYSSLSYLRTYPINKIKIDRSFVANLSFEDASREVVATMIHLAHALKLSVIAEGVETVEQHDWLSAAGCPDAQGYLFGAAMPVGEIGRLWQAQASVPTDIDRSVLVG